MNESVFRQLEWQQEVPLCLLAIFLVISLGRTIVRRRYAHDAEAQKWFMRGLQIKLLGAIAIGLLYYLFYGGGDAFEFFFQARKIRQVLFADVVDGLDFLFFDYEEGVEPQFTKDAQMYLKYGVPLPHYMVDPKTFLVVQLITPFCVLAFGSFFAASVLVAFLAHLGLWGFYRTLQRILPIRPQNLPAFIFYMPSIAVWSSGLMKETFSLMFLLYIFYFQNKINLKNIPQTLLYLVLILISGWVVYNTKSYTIIAFGPLLFFLFVIKNVRESSSPFIKILFNPFFILIIFVGSGLFLMTQGDTFKEFSLEKNLEEAQIKQKDLTSSYYYEKKGGGSVYLLPEYEANLQGFLSVMPDAIVVSFFRPYLWEASNLLILFTALESFAVSLIILYALIRTGVFGLVIMILKDPVLSLFLFGSIIFGVFCALSSGNFGNLARYKIPAMPFFLVALNLIIFYTTRRYKALKAKQKEAQLLRTTGSIRTHLA